MTGNLKSDINFIAEFLSYLKRIFSITQIWNSGAQNRYRPRFFDQVGHQTTYASMGNKHFIATTK